MGLNNLPDRVEPGMIFKSVALSIDKERLAITLVFCNDRDQEIPILYRFTSTVKRDGVEAIAAVLMESIGSRVVYWNPAGASGASYAFENGKHGRFGEVGFAQDN